MWVFFFYFYVSNQVQHAPTSLDELLPTAYMPGPHGNLKSHARSNTLTVLGAIDTIIKAPEAHSKSIREEGIRSSIKTPTLYILSRCLAKTLPETVIATELHKVIMPIFAGKMNV